MIRHFEEEVGLMLMLIWKIIYSEKNSPTFMIPEESVELIIDQIFSLTNDDRPIKPFHGFYLSILQYVVSNYSELRYILS